jgi:hypothetical protein
VPTNASVGAQTPDFNLTNDDFLKAVFGDRAGEAMVCVFGGDPHAAAGTGAWAGRKWDSWKARGVSGAGENTYWSVSLFLGDERKAKEITGTYAVVVDDVTWDEIEGTEARVVRGNGKAAVRAGWLEARWGRPSYRLETSPGNEQWGYLLTEPDPRGRRVGRLVQRLTDKRNPSGVGFDPGMGGANRLVRLPVGTNLKPENLGFVHRLVEWNPSKRFDLVELGQALGVDLGDAVGDGPPTAGTGASKKVGGSSTSRQAFAPGSDPILDQLDKWGMLGSGPTNDGGWHVECPWSGEHTGMDGGAAVWEGMRFKCHHAHCAGRGGAEFKEWFNERLRCEAADGPPAGGNAPPPTNAAGLMFEPVEGETWVPASASVHRVAGPDLGDLLKAAFLKEWVLVMEEGRFWSMTSRRLADRTSLWTRAEGLIGQWMPVVGRGARARRMPVATWWTGLGEKGGAQVAYGLVHRPGEGVMVQMKGGLWANTWRESRVGKRMAAEALGEDGIEIEDWMIEPWLELVRHLGGHLGTGLIEGWLDWMALLVGDPRIKPGWHVVINGGQGIGKDLVMMPVRWGVGDENSVTVGGGDLHGGFSGWAKARLVVIAELNQSATAGANGRDNYRVLKSWTENTSDTVWVNEKHRRQYETVNASAFYITSNEDAPLALEPGDRRFMVITSPADKWERDRYAALAGWMNGPTGAGTEAVCAWLRVRWARMDAGRRAALMGRAPDGADKNAMIEAGDPLRGWMREQIESRAWPWDLMTSSEIEAELESAKRRGALRWKPFASKWAAVLKELGGGKVAGGEKVRMPNGKYERVWAIRTHKRYSRLCLDDVRTAHLASRKLGQGGGSEEATGGGVVLPFGVVPEGD